MIYAQFYPQREQDSDTINSVNESAINTLVVIHGLFGNSDNWHSIAHALSDQFNVYAIDLPNHGKSTALKHASYEATADLINQWLLDTNIKQCFVLGHSMGGKVAMQIATQFPEKIKGLIVADIAPVAYQAGHDDIFKGLKAIIPEDIQNRKQADHILAEYEPNLSIRQFLLKSLVKNDQGFKWIINIENLFNSYELILSAPPIQTPFQGETLFIKGENSNYIQAKYKDDILKWFPKAQIKIISNTGHWLHAEKPVPFTSLVRRFCLQSASK